MQRPLKRGILGASTIILINMLLCVVRILMKQTLLTLEQSESGVRDVLDLNKNIGNFGISRDIL